jgi:transposase
MYSRLTDKQWAKIEPFVVLPRRADNRGRPWNNARSVVDGILFVLHSGCAWNQLPRSEYPAYQTCHRWFQRLVEDGTLHKLVESLADEAGVDLSECFIDGTFVAAKKGAIVSGGATKAMEAPSS